ncbi:hypothetical protein I7I50_09657 [Histoplasma capsulatum G186AR]|uniref:Uncharacterized protein n=1 Tax=Ajellomyces capsulatus TaxID=5037 RepID=A0A8H8D1J3_AJECA|nr:hypothetical protein I7I52_07187 [Histoplasma capsulatum]QSS74461.1 hypothetical protein I7I50_09657 [Histoplasma capsulatum G186AR]
MVCPVIPVQFLPILFQLVELLAAMRYVTKFESMEALKIIFLDSKPRLTVAVAIFKQRAMSFILIPQSMVYI